MGVFRFFAYASTKGASPLSWTHPEMVALRPEQVRSSGSFLQCDELLKSTSIFLTAVL